MRATLAERFAARLQPGSPEDCWLWLGPVGTSGYGRVGNLYAHRVAYEFTNGPIVQGAHVDHLCRNRLCCNPSHLEAVTQRENNRRASEIGYRDNPTTCKNGHDWLDEAPYEHTRADGRTQRQCRQCHRDNERRRYHARVAA